ncbi:MAG: T9SS type A sorting domain-containing protein [Bacteroidales bacterium]|nr:T9SS type A sorting domain-containing protein [Bacteroidales bacterium]
MKKLTASIATILLVWVTLLAQNNMDITWQNCYGGTGSEDHANLLETNFGYFILSETNSVDGQITNQWGEEDIWLVAIDSVGNFLWGRCYGGSSLDLAQNIVADNLGFYYFSGVVASNDGDIQSGNHGGYDRWVVKIDATGKILWEKCYGGTGNEYGAKLKRLSKGNIILYAATTSGDGDVPQNYGFWDAWIQIINPQNGDIIQNKVFGNSDINNIFDIVETRDGGFFFTSKAIVANGMIQGDPHGGEDVWAVKTDSNLNIEWQKLYGGSHNDGQGEGILELDDGYIFMAYTLSNDGDVSGFHGIPGELETLDIWVVRIDTIGNIIWEKCLGGSGMEDARKLIQSDDGGFVLFAQTDSDDGDVWDLHTDYNNQHSDIWMVKLSANGDIEWSRCYGGIGGEKVSFDAVIKKAEDDYVISGTTYYYLNPSGDVGCNYIGMGDIWLFEIKDCDNYMPQIPASPSGPDTLCTTTDSISTYSITPAQGAWSYEWQVLPEEAGSIASDSITATLHWSPNWEGQTQISVRSWNDCGQSDWSDVKSSWAFSCLGIHSPSAGTHGPYLQIFPNPASTQIQCNIQNMDRAPEGSIEIYNYLGVRMNVLLLQGKQKSINIDISSYPPGIYVALLKSGSDVLAMGRFVKN